MATVEEFLQLTHLTRPELCQRLKISPRAYYRLVSQTGVKAAPNPKANEIRILLSFGESADSVADLTDSPKSYVTRIQGLMKAWPCEKTSEGLSWTKDEENRLLALRALKVPRKKIAEVMGRTVGAIDIRYSNLRHHGVKP